MMYAFPSCRRGNIQLMHLFYLNDSALPQALYIFIINVRKWESPHEV